MIEFHYDKTVSVKRLSADVNDREQYAEHIAEVECMIQPVADSFDEDVDGNFGKNHIMFCAVLDIKEGDRLTDLDSEVEYKVVGVRSHKFRGREHHMELSIREFSH